jgi:ribosomal protein S18 acetylase RimI-like enzyme
MSEDADQGVAQGVAQGVTQDSAKASTQGCTQISLLAPQDFAPEIHRLFQRAYAVEARLINVRDFPPLARSCSAIQEAKSEFFGARTEADLRGVIELEHQSGVVLIASLVVDPDYFRQGLARLLLQHVISIYAKDFLRVETATANRPAMALYASLGFELRGEFAKADGLRMSRLERKRN